MEIVELALHKYGRPIYVRRQIVHNIHVVQRLESLGAIFVEEISDIPAGAVVILSAHGVAPTVKQAATNQGMTVIDATCPLVAKVHQEVRRFAAADYDILLVGHDGHEEVVGTTGHAPARVQVVESAAAADQIQVRDPNRTVWLSQTTLSVDETHDVVDALRERFPGLADPPSDDICYASQNRQDAVKRIAGECQLVLVVGSVNSSNSLRLVEVAKAAGAAAAFLIDDAGDIDPDWLAGVETVGLTSGASAPEELVEGVLTYLAEHGYAQVEVVETTRETLSFAVPAVLRS